MMLTELLATLRDLNVQLYLENDHLRCKAPPNTLTTELRNQLSARKQELIGVLKQVQPEQTLISKAPPNEAIPLSFAQQRLWFLDQLEPANAFYNITIALRLTGQLNKTAVQYSFNEIVRRHESLRTAFITVDGLAVQKILDAQEVRIRQFTVSSNAEALALCQQDAERGFDLSSGDLMRVSLLELKPDEHILVVTLHHIIMDGWSSAILTREFAALYAAYTQHLASPLPELALQYADFAYWQRHWLTGAVLAQQSDYWRAQLQNAPTLLELPTDYARPPVMTHHGANYVFSIPTELMNEINVLRQQQQTTLFMTLLTAFMVLLARYSQQTDLCVGTPFANRQRAELEDLIGFFVNTIVIRADLATATTFEQLLQQIKQTVLAAKQHQDLPFEQLVELLQPERNRSYSPLFQVMFVLQNAAPHSLKLENLTVSPVEQAYTAAKFDLTLHIYPTESSCMGVLEYNTDLFTEATMARLAQHYLMLLQGIVNHPQTRWQDLPLLTTQEYQQLVFDWNTTSSSHDEPALFLHSLFEQQVAKTPDAWAVVFAEQQLTYRELNAKANQLARYLQQQGVKADDLVGLCVERSLFMMIGMIGILKAGGAYLPLDPAYPRERLSYMLEDSQANIILTQQALLSTVQALTQQAKIICLDRDSQTIARYDRQNLLPAILPLNLAYCIYTSGSTGKPKGVLLSHANAVHSTTARFQTYQDRVQGYLLLSSFAFDSSIAGLFWTLTQGGYLCLPTEEQSKDVPQLAHLIKQHDLSHLLALPSLYDVLLKQGAGQLASLKVAIVAGESCQWEIVKQHYQTLPQVKLYNEYGPTENSVWSSVYLTRADDTNTHVSIGRPIPNVQIYLLDKAYQPVPVGVVGEIYLGGIGIARGYLHQAGLTAEKFIPHPFANGQRLYKTGDLARYRADGFIEFLGRIDHQVKIRGFRIELGEIEARLLELTEVAAAVVEVKNQYLVAYIVGKATESDLKHHLAQVLPAYMLPSAFVFLEQLPLTANGKLNRNALPIPHLLSANQYRAPSTEMERALARIWSQLLARDDIGVDDDFFALGGHSLLATQLLFAVRDLAQNNQQLTLKNFFAQPTIAAQAKLMTGQSLASINLAEEVQLADDIQPIANAVDVVHAEHIFLTGATGFLGAFLLAELIEHSNATIYCLIRADDETQALQRLRAQLQRFELIERINFQRVIAVCGDLAKPNLGLTPERYREIAEQVTVIYHNGALVNFVQPYTQLKPANVLGTQAVLKLAATHTAKAIHYVSTLSVFSDNPPTNGFAETDDAKLTEQLENGYAQTKWVAEKIIWLAIKRGFPITIYRPATVAGDSINGIWNSDDFLCRLLKGCIQLGLAPDDNQRVELAPVNYISHAIVTLSQQPEAIGACFHLNSPHATYTQDILNWFDHQGYTMRRVSYSAWAKQVLEQAAQIENFALAPLLSLFSETSEPTEPDEQQDRLQYSCVKTQQMLAKLGIVCPTLNHDLLERYLRYFLRSQFL